jgi:elongation factor G
VKIVAESLPHGSNPEFVFENGIVGGTVPKEYIPSVEKGLESVLGSGVLAGFPVVDLRATLIEGAYHDVDSSALAFEICARAALREALQKGAPVLLEPVMKVEVVTPDDYTGSVIGDLNSRRGQIQGQDMRGNANVISAMAPLATCSAATSTRCARCRRDAPLSQCNSITTLQYLCPTTIHHFGLRLECALEGPSKAVPVAVAESRGKRR